MQKHHVLKATVRGAYDIQQLRIQIGNRIVANFRSRLGIEPGEKDSDSKKKKLLDEIRGEFKRITDGIAHRPKKSQFEGTTLIGDYAEMLLIFHYENIAAAEAQMFKDLKDILAEYPIYNEWLKHQKGVGPAMAGCILSEIDIHKARYPSSVWKYCGLDVAEDGKGRSRRKEHLVEVEYKNKDGEMDTKLSITFNPFIKTKLIGVLAASFLKSKSPYADIYYNYKRRLENHAVYKDVADGHRHNMALRYMVKIFLIDLYTEWRKIEGLEVSKPYHEAKLGYKHQEATAA